MVRGRVVRSCSLGAEVSILQRLTNVASPEFIPNAIEHAAALEDTSESRDEGFWVLRRVGNVGVDQRGDRAVAAPLGTQLVLAVIGSRTDRDVSPGFGIS